MQTHPQNKYCRPPVAGLRRGRPASQIGGAGERGVSGATAKAFTLIELLVVIGIIGILATVGIPAIKGMSKSNAIAAADRQMLDDIGYARQRAMADHTTVYMVFVPPLNNYGAIIPPGDANMAQSVSNLYASQYTGYALLSLRSVGDQPGRSTPRYLTAWRTLPNGIYIPLQKFGQRFSSSNPPPLNPPLQIYDLEGFITNTFPYPTISTNANQVQYTATLPCIGFNFQGQLVASPVSGPMDEIIPLAQGSVFYARDANGVPSNQGADVQELPPGNTVYDAAYPNNNFNQIHIDWLTGQARVEKPQVQ